MGLQERMISNFVGIIRQYEDKVVELEMEVVAGNHYTLDIHAINFYQDTVVKLINTAIKYKQYRTHELLDGYLRIHFELND